MAGIKNPSKTRFVVRRVGGESDELQRRAEGLGRVEPLEEGSELSILELDESSEDAREAWQKVKKALGPEHEVAPVLVDDQGEERYPTGKLTVRFDEAPSDEELTRFAAEHGLEVEQRNKWVAHQADFNYHKNPEGYLPELVGKLEQKKGVKAAWPATLGRYRRF